MLISPSATITLHGVHQHYIVHPYTCTCELVIQFIGPKLLLSIYMYMYMYRLSYKVHNVHSDYFQSKIYGSLLEGQHIFSSYLSSNTV